MNNTSNKNINFKLIDQFDELTKHLCQNNLLQKLNFKDAYIWKNHNSKIDILINSCTHGNEIIGLSIINHILNLIKVHKISTQLNIAFVLANRNAVMANARIVNKDLNRSFSTNLKVHDEDYRAKELEFMAHESSAIFDIHQTTTESESPFFVMRHIGYNYSFINEINISEWPIILYREGKFSNDGDAYSSYCLQHKIPFITLELLHLGIHPILEEKINQALINIFKKFNSNSWNELLQNSKILETRNDKFQEDKVILKNTNDDYLVDGLKNLSPISTGSQICCVGSEKIFAEKEYYSLFPKYGIYKINASELVRLLIKI